jgi:hypothetical protein
MELKNKASSKPVKFRAETLVRETMATNVKNIINTDRKARIVIIVNVALISIIISSYTYINQSKLSQLPLLIILISNCLCLLLAIRSVGQLGIRKNKPKEYERLLDYQVYIKNGINAFVSTMHVRLASKRDIFTLALIEMYGQGELLDKKNRYLNYAFACLGLGLNLAILIFLLERTF